MVLPRGSTAVSPAKIGLACVAVTAFLVGPVRARAEGLLSPAELVARMQAVGRKVASYQVLVRQTVVVGEQQLGCESQVYWKSPDRLAVFMTLGDPAKLTQRVFFDGQTVYQATTVRDTTDSESPTWYGKYDASAIPLEELPAGLGAGAALNPVSLAEVALAGLDPGKTSVSEGGVLDGQPTYLVEGPLSEAGRSREAVAGQPLDKLKFWIGASDYFLRKWEAYARDKLVFSLECIGFLTEPPEIEEHLVSPVPAGVVAPDITMLVRSEMLQQTGKFAPLLAPGT